MPETAQNFEGLRERLDEVRRRIETCARRQGRDPAEITLVAVSKMHPPALLRQAIEAGASDLGENRVQEAEAKIEELGSRPPRWHLIGHLQANKARRAVTLFDVIQSVDSLLLARRLDRLCREEGRASLPVMIQVDLAGEESKTGVSEDDLPGLVSAVKACERLRLTGLMTLPPFFVNAERARPYFRRLRELRDTLSSRLDFEDSRGELSMGMSNDYEVAIEEGATVVRVGTAIFGERGVKPPGQSH